MLSGLGCIELIAHLSGLGCIELIAHYYADIYDADKRGLRLLYIYT
jgi:hypothetical protein